MKLFCCSENYLTLLVSVRAVTNACKNAQSHHVVVVVVVLDHDFIIWYLWFLHCFILMGCAISKLTVRGAEELGYDSCNITYKLSNAEQVFSFLTSDKLYILPSCSFFICVTMVPVIAGKVMGWSEILSVIFSSGISFKNHFLLLITTYTWGGFNLF